MEIYLIRHAAAVDLDNEIVEEGFRYLNPDGRKKSAEVAKKLKELKTKFDVIFCSPLVRAVQTAEIFASVLRYKGEVKTVIELIGGHAPSKFRNLIHRNNHYKRIAFIGHVPDVYHFAVNLLKNNNNEFKEPKFHFHNCSVFKIDYDHKNETGKLVYFLDSNKMEIIME
jgi:phosphohistidine phosphatase